MTIERDLMHASTLIKLENDRQLEKWGEQDRPLVEGKSKRSADLARLISHVGMDAKHRIDTGQEYGWLDIIIEELGELVDADSKGDMTGAREESVQVAAVAKMMVVKL